MHCVHGLAKQWLVHHWQTRLVRRSCPGLVIRMTTVAHRLCTAMLRAWPPVTYGAACPRSPTLLLHDGSKAVGGGVNASWMLAVKAWLHEKLRTFPIQVYCASYYLAYYLHRTFFQSMASMLQQRL